MCPQYMVAKILIILFNMYYVLGPLGVPRAGDTESKTLSLPPRSIWFNGEDKTPT